MEYYRETNLDYSTWCKILEGSTDKKRVAWYHVMYRDCDSWWRGSWKAMSFQSQAKWWRLRDRQGGNDGRTLNQQDPRKIGVCEKILGIHILATLPRRGIRSRVPEAGPATERRQHVKSGDVIHYKCGILKNSLCLRLDWSRVYMIEWLS